MSEWFDSNRIGPVTINGSATAIPAGGNPSGTSTNIVFDVRGLGTAAIQTITTSSLAYKIYVSVDGGTTWSPVRTANSAGTATAADTAITASTTVTDYIPVATATHMRVTRTAGSGTIYFGGHPDPEVFQSSSAASGTVDTELPAAAALADNTANPTVPGVGSFGHVWDGATWDRAPGNSSSGTFVQAQAGTAIIGSTPPVIREVAVTFSLDTSAYAANDVLADSQVVTNAVSANDAKGYLVGFQILDEDDNAAADIDLILLSANVSVGTENSAISISDANARNILHVISIDDTEFKDLINSKIATRGVSSGPWPIIPASGTRNIYAALVYRGAATPTYSASGITARLYFQDAM